MRKILGDNVDSHYHFAPLTGDRAYRIRGRRGNDVYLAFCVYGGKPDGEWSERVVANVSQRDIRFGPDGAFELVLARERPASERGQWIKLEPDAVCVIVRQYFAEPRDASPAELAIATLEPAPAPAPLSDALLARRLRAVATFMRETLGVVPLPAFPMPNVLGPPMPWSPHVPGWGTPDNIYALGEFRLAPDEALVIEGRSPRCTYWGVQLWNRYMQSLDYRHHRVSINGTQAVLERDGSFRVVVAHRDPGVPNWLEPAGHPEGLVFCRWLQAEELPAQPASRVVSVGDLAAAARA
jgi:hypothetical protein